MIILPKLTDKEKKKIIADYVDNGNYSETARINNTSDMTVKRLVEKEENKGLLKKVEQKKLENTQSTLEYMDSQHETKKRIIGKLLKAIEEKSENIDMFTSVKDLATAYGILIDKELKYLEARSILNETNKTAKNGIITELIGALNNAKESK